MAKATSAWFFSSHVFPPQKLHSTSVFLGKNLITVLASKKTRCFLLLNELQKYNNFNKLHVFRFFLFLCRTHYPTVEYYADGWRGLKAPFFFTPLRGGTHYPLASYCPADGCSRNCFCILWAIADPIGEGSIRGCSRPRILRPPSPPLPKS